MGTQPGIFLHHLKQCVFHLHGFQRAQAYPAHLRYGKGGLYRIGQPVALAVFLAVAAQMDAQQHDFLKALIHQPLGFFTDAFQGTGTEMTSGVGNDAIGAVLVAAFLDFQERPVPAFVHGRFHSLKAPANGQLVNSV